MAIELSKFWWLSFCDATRPKGTQLLGVVVTEAETMAGAIQRAWALEVNPGGEVLSTPVSEEMIPLLRQVGAGYIDRLLTRHEAEELDELLRQLRIGAN